MAEHSQWSLHRQRRTFFIQTISWSTLLEEEKWQWLESPAYFAFSTTTCRLYEIQRIIHAGDMRGKNIKAEHITYVGTLANNIKQGVREMLGISIYDKIYVYIRFYIKMSCLY